MKITSAELKVMATRRSQYPEDKRKEFLLVGRSNVGKSSFINTLLGRKNLAKTSSHPGKTQTLNFYEVNKEFYLIDVPGYGYAEVSKKNRQKFGKMIEAYKMWKDELGFDDSVILYVAKQMKKPNRADLCLKENNSKFFLATSLASFRLLHKVYL